MATTTTQASDVVTIELRKWDPTTKALIPYEYTFPYPSANLVGFVMALAESRIHYTQVDGPEEFKQEPYEPYLSLFDVGRNLQISTPRNSQTLRS